MKAIKEILDMSNITDVINETEFSNETADADKKTVLSTQQNGNRSDQYSCFPDKVSILIAMKSRKHNRFPGNVGNS